jgi:class 3 adenylate cyclase
MRECASCGAENAEDASFCSACGSPLLAQATSVRKTVTVLFCDLVGSTAMGDGADPEVLRGQMTRYHAQLKAVLERHGGTVEKFIGDAAMAVFGLPSAHEDDALRAVRAAVESRSSVSKLGCDVRIGINTGEIVAGEGATLVTGDAVNVAARLEQAAGSGEILIGELTQRLVRDAIRSEPLEALTLKGKSAPVAAFRVLEVHAGAPAFTRRLEVPFVGREQELAHLRGALERAINERAPQLATIVGPPGIGKSRLVAELIAVSDAQVLTGHCLSYGQGITYWPLQEIASQVADIRAALGEIDEAELAAARIAAALGESTASSDEIAWGFRKLFETLAQAEPLIVLIDDIHWAEETLLDLLDYLADFSRDARLLVLCTARPELLETRPGWATQRPNATLLTIEPLPQSDIETLVAELGNISADDRKRIIDAAEGNPLFVEQLMAMHAEFGRGEGRLEIPPTIQALLAARIDRLDTDERTVIERASVEGRLFHRGSVRHLVPEPARPEVGRRLSTLVRRQFIRPDRTELPGDDAFRFDHILIRDAAYDSLPKKLRAELHELYADWLEERLGDDAPPEILGYHLEQAHSYRVELGDADAALAERAAARLASAARVAAARQDRHAQINLLERASQLSTDVQLQARLQADLGNALGRAGHTDRAIECLQEAERLGREAGDGNVEWVARLNRRALESDRDPAGAPDLLMREGEAAIAARPEQHEVLARAWRIIGLAHNWRGHTADAHDAYRVAWEHAHLTGDAGLEMEIIYPSGGPIAFGPIPVEEGLRWVSDVVARALNRPAAEFWSRHMFAHLHARLGDFDAARAAMLSWRMQLHELGEESLYVATAGCAWDICSLAGDWAGGEQALRESYEILESSGDVASQAYIAALLADALLRQGKLDEADRYSAAGQELSVSDDVMNSAAWRRVRARVLAQRGNVEAALSLAHEATELMSDTDFLDEHAAAWLDLAEILKVAGKTDDAKAAIGEAIALYEAKGNLVGRARAEALLAAA